MTAVLPPTADVIAIERRRLHFAMSRHSSVWQISVYKLIFQSGETFAVERRLAAIVVADVVGYSKLIQSDEAGTRARFQVLQNELIEPAAASHGGRIIKTMGDAFLLEFPSAVGAVAWAVQVQRNLADQDGSVAAGEPMHFRIGINLGDVIVEGDDIHGDGVNVAARLEGLAEPGGILISGKVYDEVAHRSDDIGFAFVGDQTVKNMQQPIPAYQVLLAAEAAGRIVEQKKSATRWPIYSAVSVALAIIAAGGLYLWQPWVKKVAPAAISQMAHALPEKPSVAILPFDNMSDDKQQDYFADGMVEDLITDLSKLPGLFIISRNSTFTYKGKAVKVQKVAEDLGVRYVVEGSVRRAGDKLRINVQLIDALSGHHIWAERYDGAMANIFDLQDQITGKIVTALAVKLVSGAKLVQVAGKETDNPAAYDAVLKGWSFLRLTMVDPKNYLLARQQFEKALRLDPTYNRAHLSLAAVYWWVSWGEHAELFGLDFQAGVDRAKSYLKTAMRQPSALAHRIQSEMYRWDEQYDKAIAEARRAIVLAPNNPEGYSALASALTHAGEPGEALKALDIADRLDPENLEPNWIRRARAHFFLKNNDKAARILERQIAAAPDYEYAYGYLIAAYGHLGRKAEATAAIKKINEIRKAKGSDRYTLVFQTGNMKYKRAVDKQYWRLGLEKAGLEAGGDVKATKYVLEKMVTRKSNGRYEIQGATTIDAKQTKAFQDQGAIIFDMRGTGGWRNGRLKSAIQARTKISDFNEKNLLKFARKDQIVIFYCSGFT